MIWAIVILAALLVGAVTSIFVALGSANKARRKAEDDRADAVQRAAASKEIADQNAFLAAQLSDYNRRLEQQMAVLRARVNEMRVRLAESADPQAVAEWLDAELKAESL